MVHLCRSLDTHLKTRLGVGEPRSSLAANCSVMGQQDSSKAHLWLCLMAGRLGGVVQGGEHAATSVAEITNLASNAAVHQKETHTSSLCLALHLPTPFLSPLLPRRGADVAHSLQEGVMQKALQSPLSHDGLGTRRKTSESCVGREGRVNPPC